jgi:hypothetical protein
MFGLHNRIAAVGPAIESMILISEKTSWLVVPES